LILVGFIIRGCVDKDDIVFDGKDVNGEKDDEQPIWLGRVMSNPDWGGQGVMQNTTGRTIKYRESRIVHTNFCAYCGYF
jgi:hypothetical protein